jgi:hypothetical protein
MDNYTAVGIAEGFEEAESEEQVIEAWQYLEDTGLAYQLQGWFGRTAQQMIAQGIIKPRTRASCVIEDMDFEVPQCEGEHHEQ